MPRPTPERHAAAADLHDLLAHRVTAIGIQAGAAAQALRADHAARPRLEAIVELVAETMGDLRRLDRLLLPVAQATMSALAPQPGLGRVAGLAGGDPPVTVDLGGLRDEHVPAGVGLCAYRALELVITECRRQGVGGVAVGARLARRRLVLTVTFPHGEPRAPARTLARVRTRIQACGGRLERAPGRWRVLLPLDI